MNKIRIGAFLSLILLITAACGGSSDNRVATSPAPPVSNPPVQTGPTASELLREDLEGLTLDQFYFDSFKALMSRSPEAVVWEALSDVFPPDEITLNNLTDEYQRETFAMYQVVKEALLTYDRDSLDDKGKLNFDIYLWHLQDETDRLPFINHDFKATYSIFGEQRSTQTFFTDIHPLLTSEDAEDYLTRLNLVGTKMNQLSEHLLRQQADGIVEPALTIQVAINQVSALAQGPALSNPYYTAFRDKVNAITILNLAERQVLIDRAENTVNISVRPGYQSLLSTLQSLLAGAPGQIGVAQYPAGLDYYNYILKHHTTSDLSAAEIHQLGLDELVRIKAEMRVIFDQLGYPQTETLRQLFTRVELDGGTIPAQDVLPTYESIIDIARQQLDVAFDIFPMADVIVLPDDFGGFYIGPAFDGSRPGAFYAGTTTSQARYSMPSLTYHESLPGHHTQIALAMEQDSPIFRKVVGFTGFIEGWALYAERLASELNWYDQDPYGDLGRLQFEALRAARLVMDTGIHSMNWTFAQAELFNRENVGWSQSASQGAAARYSVTPGQASAYMVGMLQILEQRERARDALGAQFDLRGFHRALLSNGAVPLALLETIVDQYIAETLQP